MSMLAVGDLAFAYRRGDGEMFGGLTHEFSPGRITAITGPSGRGKSTLLYILGLLMSPSGGTVTVAGRVWNDAPDASRSAVRAAEVGFVFQDASLDPTRTVLDAVIEPALYAGRVRRDVVPFASDLLQKFGVLARAAHRPGEISGGQAQRVAVARALVNDPAVLLADEPTGNLDRANATDVLDALRTSLVGARVVVIATHDPFVIDHADEVLRL